MIFSAVLLAVLGSLLLSVSAFGLWPRKAEIWYEPVITVCDAPSPDDSLRCDAEIGHFGWHRCSETSWYGDTWAVDQYSDTQASPTLLADVYVKPDYLLAPVRRGIFGVALRHHQQPERIAV